MSTALQTRPGRARRGLPATLGAAVLALGLVLATGSPVLAATGSDDVALTVSGEPCAGTGVDVVVDLPATDTDAAAGADDAATGGEVRLGCAPEVGVTGTEALNAAGFTETRDAATMICAIEDHPDPCPTEFEGVYWSYWYADTTGDEAGQWQQYMEGSDTTVTQQGRVEGWRYGDGAEGPRVDPLALATAGDVAQDEGDAGDEPADESTEERADDSTEPTAGTDDDAQDDATEDDAGAATADDGAASDAPVWPWVVGGVVVLALAALLIRSRRGATDGSGATPGGDEV